MNTLEFAQQFGFNAVLVVALGGFIRWLIIEHKAERSEWRGVIESQHRESTQLIKENNVALSELTAVVYMLGEKLGIEMSAIKAVKRDVRERFEKI